MNDWTTVGFKTKGESIISVSYTHLGLVKHWLNANLRWRSPGKRACICLNEKSSRLFYEIVYLNLVAWHPFLVPDNHGFCSNLFKTVTSNSVVVTDLDLPLACTMGSSLIVSFKHASMHINNFLLGGLQFVYVS